MVLVLATLALSGCYAYVEEDELDAQATADAETSEEQPARTGAADGVVNAPRPAAQGVKRVADNTADRLAEHQRELEKQMEEDQ